MSNNATKKLSILSNSRWFDRKTIIILTVLITSILLYFFGKTFIAGFVNSPSLRAISIEIARIIIPLKNSILMRGDDEKKDLIKSKGECIFCDLSNMN
jgi:hypothetical protein